MTAVGVYLKYPQPGMVKTRLAATIGPERAARAYARMIEHVLGNVLSVLPDDAFEIVLCCDPFRPLDEYRKLFASYPYSFAPQSGKDLGERLAGTFESLLRRHGAAVAIGTDCIALQPAHLAEVPARLATGADLVVGPAVDGGYYLIAAKRFHPELFEGIPWSSDKVLAETYARARALGLKVSELETLPDIDTAEDLAASGLDSK